MTDLEDLWERYPASDPPIAALLGEGRRRAHARRRHLVVRPLLAAATTAALAGAFLVGNRTEQAPRDTVPDLRVSAFRADLHPAASCDQLLESYRRRGAAAVTAYGWGGPLAYLALDGLRGGSVRAAAPLPRDTVDTGSSATGTNVQETDVDESDQVKTDGTLIARVHGSTLTVYDASGPTIRQTGRLVLPHVTDAEILLAGQTAVVIGPDATGRPDPLTRSDASAGPRTRVLTVSLADRTDPTVVSDVAYTGAVSSVRQHGTVARIVLTAGPPALDFVYPHGRLTRAEALRRNRQLVQGSTLTDWLPTYDDGSGARPLLDCDDVALPPSGLALGTVGIIGFDAATPASFDAIGIAGQTTIAYESTDHLYLTDSPFHSGGSGRTRTTLFQFDLDGKRASHVATGHVVGRLVDRWSMDEADDVLRVAVTHGDGVRGTVTRSSSVVTLRADGHRLVEHGRLGGLGIDQAITAARWSDDLAFLSTARQADPLYTIDLTDPSAPRLLGALHIPGATTYVHPIGDGMLLGIGTERDRAQVALFDIADLTDVRRIDVRPLGRSTWPIAADDPRAFTWLSDRSTALTSFATPKGTVLGTYQVAGGALTERLRPLPGADPTNVRTFALADGRVVLMVGSRLEFLDL